MNSKRINSLTSLITFASLIISAFANGDHGQIVQRPDTSYISQENIGIPGGSEYGASRSSGSALAPQDFIPQQNIGFPGDSGAGVRAGSGTGAISPSRGISFGGGGHGIDMVTVGGMGPIPLAVNSRHRIEYVDMPSTMMRVSGGSSVSPASSSGGAALGGGYITQQNIGIPGDYGMSMMRGGSIGRPASMGSSWGGGQRKISSPASYGRGATSGGGYGARSGVPTAPIGGGGSVSTGGGVSTGGAVSASRGYSGGGGGVITLPVISRHRVEYVDVPSTGSIQPVSIEIPATNLGVMFNFKSASSPIKVTQSHEPSPGSYQETSSVEEPIRLSHTVRRPIIQEVRETVQPFRKVTQEVHPVQEDIRTIVAVRAGSRPGGGGHSYGTSSGGAIGSSGGSYPGVMTMGSGGTGYSGVMSMSSGGSRFKTRPTSSGGGAAWSGAGSPASIGRTNTAGWSSASSGSGYPTQQKISGGGDDTGMPGIVPPAVPGESSSSMNSGAARSRKKKPGNDDGSRRFYDGSYGRGQGLGQQPPIQQMPIGQERIYK